MENKKYNILIIDDNSLDRAIYKRLLSKLKDVNFTFYESSTFEDGLDICKNNSLDCVIVDNVLPDILSIEGIVNIKNISVYISIVAVSAYGDESIAAEFIKRGADDYISKSEIKEKHFQDSVINSIKERSFKNSVIDNQQKLENILNTVMDGIVVIKQGGTIVSVNATLERIFGYSSYELVGKNFSILIPLGSFNKYKKYIREQIQLKGKKVFLGVEDELQGVRKDGSVFFMEIGVSEMEVSREVYFVASVHDVTIRKNNEEALKEAKQSAVSASKAKSNFLATMSHEIRTPMNGVIGITELLLYTDLSARQKKYVDIIKSSGEHLLVLINDILDFSKIEAGELKLENQEISLDKIILEIEKILEVSIKENNIDFSVEYVGNIPFNLVCDQVRLKQIIVNLASNAIKFSNNGEVKIRVTLESRSSKDVDLLFEFIDTGIGIAEEDKEKIFEKFSQVQSLNSRKYGGTGLGLAIVKNLLNLMGGTIGVESTQGEGSVFWFRVNFPISSEEKYLDDNNSLEFVKDVRFLIVDDYKTNRHILSVYLNNFSCSYGTASSGKEALKILDDSVKSGETYDVVFIDYIMPGISGTELAEKIRKDIRYSKITLIITSTLNKLNKHITKENMDLFDGYIEKPFRKNILFTKLFDIVKKSNPDLIKASIPDKSDFLKESFEASKPKKRGSKVSSKVSSKASIKGKAKTTVLVKKKKTSLSEFKANILIVEDLLPNQEVVLEILKQMGCKASVASDGAVAIEMLEKNHEYDCIFMDCEMPNMNGFEATKIIRKKSWGKKMKIVAMTANALQGDMQKCLDIGMDYYISKPISIKAVENIFNKIFPNK